jgi:putative NIF3 family GTP cyclohydrolase 1 type 2
VRERFPEEWADKSWDNVGMLVDNLKMAREEEEKPVVMLTNDLTPAVAAEATAKGASVIVSYREVHLHR